MLFLPGLNINSMGYLLDVPRGFLTIYQFSCMFFKIKKIEIHPPNMPYLLSLLATFYQDRFSRQQTDRMKGSSTKILLAVNTK